MKKYFIAALIFLCSCTAQKRLNRLIGNHPELAQVQVVDKQVTITETDTFYVPEKVVDTFFNWCTDTVFHAVSNGVDISIKREQEHYRVITKILADTFYVKDTIQFTYRDTVNVFTVQPVSTSEIWCWRKQGALWLLILLIIIYLGQLAVRMYLKGQIPFMKF
jgi:hypothetical protein